MSPVLYHQVLFVLTGVLSTIGYQWIFYQGAGGGGFSMITVLPSYIGMIFPLLKPSNRNRFLSLDHPKSTHKLIFTASTCDITGSMLTAVGLFYCGSGLYQVLYSSVIVFTALIARIFLSKPLTTNQWIAVFLVNIGLALSAGVGDMEGSSASKRTFIIKNETFVK